MLKTSAKWFSCRDNPLIFILSLTESKWGELKNPVLYPWFRKIDSHMLLVLPYIKLITIYGCIQYRWFQIVCLKACNTFPFVPAMWITDNCFKWFWLYPVYPRYLSVLSRLIWNYFNVCQCILFLHIGKNLIDLLLFVLFYCAPPLVWLWHWMLICLICWWLPENWTSNKILQLH